VPNTQDSADPKRLTRVGGLGSVFFSADGMPGETSGNPSGLGTAVTTPWTRSSTGAGLWRRSPTPRGSPEERAEFQRLLQKLDGPTPAPSRNAPKPAQTQRTQDDHWELQPRRIAEVVGVDAATVRGWVQENLLTADASGRIIVNGRSLHLANLQECHRTEHGDAPGGNCQTTQASAGERAGASGTGASQRAISSAEYTAAKQAVLEGR
jgi:hypothetical protein